MFPTGADMLSVVIAAIQPIRNTQHPLAPLGESSALCRTLFFLDGALFVLAIAKSLGDFFSFFS